MKNTRLSIVRRVASLPDDWPEIAERIRPAALYLYRLRDHLYEDLERVLQPYDLRPADMDVLASLRTSPPPHELTPTALYRSLLLSSGGLTKIVHRLEVRGLVVRPENPDDRRSRLVRLTAAGRKCVDEVIEAVIEHEGRFMAMLSPAEEAELARLLERLLLPLEP